MTSSFNQDFPAYILEKIKGNRKILKEEVKELIYRSMSVFIDDSNLLKLNSPITICGDIHGQLEDLFELFNVSGGEENGQYLFMGDFVDRGYYSIDTICYLLALRLKRKCIYLLRGNHEARDVNTTYGFYMECLTTYNDNEVFNLFNDLFDMFPIAAIIDGKVFSVHGGISPRIPYYEKINEINRFVEVPQEGAMADLLWSDPSTNIDEWMESKRGAGYNFGSLQCKQFIHLNNLELITRSHQLVMDGIMWMFNDTLVDIWSAPNYGYQNRNTATTMKYEGKPPRENKINHFDQNKERRPIDTKSKAISYFA